MITVGKLERRDIGPGVWMLKTDERSWVLRGSIPGALEGKQVEVTGSPEENFGIEMSGPTLRVTTIRALHN